MEMSIMNLPNFSYAQVIAYVAQHLAEQRIQSGTGPHFFYISENGTRSPIGFIMSDFEYSLMRKVKKSFREIFDFLFPNIVAGDWNGYRILIEIMEETHNFAFFIKKNKGDFINLHPQTQQPIVWESAEDFLNHLEISLKRMNITWEQGYLITYRDEFLNCLEKARKILYPKKTR